MFGSNITTTADAQQRYIKHYYRLHAQLYDFTRWAFLFGRNSLIKALPFASGQPLDILEVGCGTGFNLKRLALRYPNATLTGVDVSEDMLAQTTRKLAGISNKIYLMEQPYGKEKPINKKFDVILFSYSLSMINPQWKEVLEQAANNLKEGGVVAIVDFHNTRVPLLWRWLRGHNVRIGGHLYNALQTTFTPLKSEIHKAYNGLWEYFLFIGKCK